MTDENVHIRNAKALAETIKVQQAEIEALKKKQVEFEQQLSNINSKIVQLEQQEIMRMVQAQGSGPTTQS